MELWQIFLLPIYCLALGSLMVFSFHRFVVVHLYFKNRKASVPEPLIPDTNLPCVTVQLPVYNELYVVERLIRAVSAFDYPGHLRYWSTNIHAFLTCREDDQGTRNTQVHMNQRGWSSSGQYKIKYMKYI